MLFFLGLYDQHLVHHYHKNEKCKDIYGEKRRGNVICNKAKKWRHKAASHVCACHLYSDYRLRSFSAEQHGSRMYDTRIYGSTAKTDNDESCQRKDRVRRDK